MAGRSNTSRNTGGSNASALKKCNELLSMLADLSDHMQNGRAQKAIAVFHSIQRDGEEFKMAVSTVKDRVNDAFTQKKSELDAVVFKMFDVITKIRDLDEGIGIRKKRITEHEKDAARCQQKRRDANASYEQAQRDWEAGKEKKGMQWLFAGITGATQVNKANERKCNALLREKEAYREMLKAGAQTEQQHEKCTNMEHLLGDCESLEDELNQEVGILKSATCLILHLSTVLELVLYATEDALRQNGRLKAALDNFDTRRPEDHLTITLKDSRQRWLDVNEILVDEMSLTLSEEETCLSAVSLDMDISPKKFRDLLTQLRREISSSKAKDMKDAMQTLEMVHKESYDIEQQVKERHAMTVDRIRVMVDNLTAERTRVQKRIYIEEQARSLGIGGSDAQMAELREEDRRLTGRIAELVVLLQAEKEGGLQKALSPLQQLRMEVRDIVRNKLSPGNDRTEVAPWKRIDELVSISADLSDHIQNGRGHDAIAVVSTIQKDEQEFKMAVSTIKNQLDAVYRQKRSELDAMQSKKNDVKDRIRSLEAGIDVCRMRITQHEKEVARCQQQRKAYWEQEAAKRQSHFLYTYILSELDEEMAKPNERNDDAGRTECDAIKKGMKEARQKLKEEPKRRTKMEHLLNVCKRMKDDLHSEIQSLKWAVGSIMELCNVLENVLMVTDSALGKAGMLKETLDQFNNMPEILSSQAVATGVRICTESCREVQATLVKLMPRGIQNALTSSGGQTCLSAVPLTMDISYKKFHHLLTWLRREITSGYTTDAMETLEMIRRESDGIQQQAKERSHVAMEESFAAMVHNLSPARWLTYRLISIEQKASSLGIGCSDARMKELREEYDQLPGLHEELAGSIRVEGERSMENAFGPVREAWLEIWGLVTRAQPDRCHRLRRGVDRIIEGALHELDTQDQQD